MIMTRKLSVIDKIQQVTAIPFLSGMYSNYLSLLVNLYGVFSHRFFAHSLYSFKQHFFNKAVVSVKQ